MSGNLSLEEAAMRALFAEFTALYEPVLAVHDVAYDALMGLGVFGALPLPLPLPSLLLPDLAAGWRLSAGLRDDDPVPPNALAQLHLPPGTHAHQPPLLLQLVTPLPAPASPGQNSPVPGQVPAQVRGHAAEQPGRGGPLREAQALLLHQRPPLPILRHHLTGRHLHCGIPRPLRHPRRRP